ncbi:hypothetical protein COOONC_06467 [Cooperia oncophora]
MMEVCVNNNNSTPAFEWSGCESSQPSTARPKRDFRFQVIEVRQGPKWFIWPNRNRRDGDEVDENHNKEAKTVGIENEYQQSTYSNQNQFSTYTTQNGYGAIRRNVLRGSKRMQLEKEGVLLDAQRLNQRGGCRRKRTRPLRNRFSLAVHLIPSKSCQSLQNTGMSLMRQDDECEEVVVSAHARAVLKAGRCNGCAVDAH